MSLILEIKVVPSSGFSKITLDKAGVLKCYLKSPPEDGKANKELIRLWADLLGVTQSAITIISGLISCKKKIKITAPLTLQDVLHKLGLDVQQSFS